MSTLSIFCIFFVQYIHTCEYSYGVFVTHALPELFEHPFKCICSLISHECLSKDHILQLFVVPNTHRQRHAVAICFVGCVKCNHVPEICKKITTVLIYF